MPPVRQKNKPGRVSTKPKSAMINCDICGESLAGDLSRHKLKHDKEKRFYCSQPGCMKNTPETGFSQKDAFDRHLANIHGIYKEGKGPRYYECPHVCIESTGQIPCPKVFRDPSALTKHRNVKHGYRRGGYEDPLVDPTAEMRRRTERKRSSPREPRARRVLPHSTPRTGDQSAAVAGPSSSVVQQPFIPLTTPSSDAQYAPRAGSGSGIGPFVQFSQPSLLQAPDFFQGPYLPHFAGADAQLVMQWLAAASQLPVIPDGQNGGVTFDAPYPAAVDGTIDPSALMLPVAPASVLDHDQQVLLGAGVGMVPPYLPSRESSTSPFEQQHLAPVNPHSSQYVYPGDV
ncbi:hypothetical protein C8Q74DRAFT_1365187 [Fomes fomentarius]|nr:hypothetical protein C8Q74DRAFT_1365187 [Fomes fomentarius]